MCQEIAAKTREADDVLNNNEKYKVSNSGSNRNQYNDYLRGCSTSTSNKREEATKIDQQKQKKNDQKIDERKLRCKGEQKYGIQRE